MGGGMDMDSWGREDQRKEQAGEDYLTSRRDQMNALGQQDLASYTNSRDTGAITAGQQASLDKYETINKAKMNQTYGDAGISSSTAANSASANIDQDILIQKDTFNQQDTQRFLSNALTELGIADTAESNLLTTQHQLAIEHAQAIQALLNSFGGSTSGSIGGGGAGGSYQQDNTKVEGDETWSNEQGTSTGGNWDYSGSGGGMGQSTMDNGSQQGQGNNMISSFMGGGGMSKQD